jgi:hypothetical protein
LEPPLPAEKAHTFRASASTPTRFESNAPPIAFCNPNNHNRGSQFG